jgi:hypothetical protein
VSVRLEHTTPYQQRMCFALLDLGTVMVCTICRLNMTIANFSDYDRHSITMFTSPCYQCKC